MIQPVGPHARRLVDQTRRRWRGIDARIRYLVVGGWNSAVAYACFAVSYFILPPEVPTSLIVLGAYIAASINGFLTFRYLVFEPRRHPLLEYFRYQMVYVPIIALNAVALPIALNATRFSAYALQAGFAVLAIIAAYIGNRYFAFGPLR